MALETAFAGIASNALLNPLTCSMIAMGQREPDWPKYVKSATGGSEPVHKTFEFTAILATNQPQFPPGCSWHVPRRDVMFAITDTNVPAKSFLVAFHPRSGRLIQSAGGTFPQLTNLEGGVTYKLTVDATDVGTMGGQKGQLFGLLKNISKVSHPTDRK